MLGVLGNAIDILEKTHPSIRECSVCDSNTRMSPAQLHVTHTVVVVLLLILSIAQVVLQSSIRQDFDDLTGTGMLWPPDGGIQDLDIIPEDIHAGSSTALIVSAALVVAAIAVVGCYCIAHWNPVSMQPFETHGSAG